MAMPSIHERPEKEVDVIKMAIKQLKDNKYKPKAIWITFDGSTIYCVTDDIDRSKFLKLMKKFK
jgi:hypothetical protein